MPNSQIAVLADGHITSDDPERTRTLVGAIDELPGSVVALYILGDLFEIWLGVPTPPPHVEAFMRAIERVRRRGVKLGYVEGNRDFLIASGRLARLFDVSSPRVLVERFGSKTYHFTHGDLVNRADRQYRMWRAFSKHVLAPAALRLLPASTALDLAQGLERRLRRTNRKHKAYFPRADCEAYAQQALADGADIVVAGHFHRSERIEVEAHGRNGLFISLPFWHQEPRLVYFDEDGGVTGL